MRLLLTEPSMGVWETNYPGETAKPLPVSLGWPCMPCACQSCVAVCCQLTRQCVCLDQKTHAVISSMPAPPGVSGMLFSPCGRWLYQLSSEADCIHTRLTATGELLYAMPCGVFPRCVRMDADGKRLLAAGGAAAEAYVLGAPEMTVQQTVYTRHPCFAADFWQGGLVLVCAVEGEDIHTAVYTLRSGKVRPRRLLELPGLPGTICTCPDGVHALLSTADGLMKLNLSDGTILWNRTEWPLCMRMQCQSGLILLSDTLSGSAALIDEQRPWQKQILFHGKNTQACFV